MGAKRGLDCVLYRNSATFGAPNWVKVDNVRDLTLGLTAEEGDASRRASRIKQSLATLVAGEFSWDMVNDPEDTSLEAIQDAFDGGDLIEFAFADGLIGDAGTKYRRFECQIFDVSEPQPLGDTSLVNVKAKPTYTTNAQGTRTTV